MATRLAYVFGVLLVILGALGFLANSLMGPNTYFALGIVHSIIFIALGVYLLLSRRNAAAADNALLVSGVIFLILAAAGFAMFGEVGGGRLLGLIHVHGEHNWLHLTLAMILILLGLAARPPLHRHPLEPH